jgi:hypothetical protein
MDSDAPKPEKPRKRRWLRRVLLAGLALLALGVLLHLLWSMSTRSGLRAEIARIRAAGDPLTLEELWPPEIKPESENAALLYQQASELLYKGGFETLAQSLGRAVSWTDPSAWSQETVATVRQMVEQNSEALSLANRAAHMTRCRFDPKWGWPPTTPIYHYAMVRQAARALCLSSALRLHDGDADGALEEARDAFLTSRALAAERTVMSLMVRQGAITMGLWAAQPVLEQHGAAPDLLRAFLADIDEARLTLRTQLVDGLKGECVTALANLAPISGMEDLLPAASRRAAPQVRANRLLGLLGQPFGRSMVAGYLDTMPRAVEMGRADYVDAQPLIDALTRDAREWQTRYVRHRSRILVAMAIPAWVRIKQDETKGEAALAVAAVAFALKLYKAEHGSYPESPHVLAPDILRAVPTDPFTGKPLVYVRGGEGFLVYSIGLNGKDDGGLKETEKEGKKLNAGTDDIAWRARR